MIGLFGAVKKLQSEKPQKLVLSYNRFPGEIATQLFECEQTRDNRNGDAKCVPDLGGTGERVGNNTIAQLYPPLQCFVSSLLGVRVDVDSVVVDLFSLSLLICTLSCGYSWVHCLELYARAQSSVHVIGGCLSILRCFGEEIRGIQSGHCWRFLCR